MAESRRWPGTSKGRQRRLDRKGRPARKDRKGCPVLLEPTALRALKDRRGLPGRARRHGPEWEPTLRFVGIQNDGQRHTLVTLDLPAGTWSLVANGMSYNSDNGNAVTCDLMQGSAVLDRTGVFLRDTITFVPFSLVGIVTLPSVGSVRLACATTTGNDDQEVEDTKIVATAVTPF